MSFQRGKHPRFGHKSLGPIMLLEDDEWGLCYEVEMLDTAFYWELAPWLAIWIPRMGRSRLRYVAWPSVVSGAALKSW